MTGLRLQRFVRLLWVITLIAALTVLLLAIPGYLRWKEFVFRNSEVPDPQTIWDSTAVWVGALSSLIGAILSITLAFLVYKRKPEDSMAVYLSFFLLYYAVIMEGPIEVFFYYWLPEKADLGTIVQTIIFSLPGMVLMLIFPNGKFEPRWTRHLVWLGILFTFCASFLDGDQLLRPTTLPALIIMGILYSIFLISLVVQIYRYFSVYTFAERLQAKWVFFGIMAWIASLGISSIPYYYIKYYPPGQSLPDWANLLSPIWFLSLSILPVSISIAILHSRLWDIDIIIRKTLVYSLLTGMLGAMYFGGVALLQKVLTADNGPQTGDRSQPSAVVIVLTTLAIAALANPLRRRLQTLIDRRFYRQKYDAEKALADFAAAARSQADLSSLTNSLVSVVQDTVQPEDVRLWIRQTNL